MLSTLLNPIKLVYGPFGKSNMHSTFDFYPIPDQTSHTIATDELLCLKNLGAQTSMFFLTQMNNWHLWQLKKSKSCALFWSYQLDSTASPANLPQKWAKWAELAVLFSR